jgi:hypothetical protein
MWTDTRQDKIRQALHVFIRAGDAEAIDRHLSTVRLAELSCEDMLTYLRTLREVSAELVHYWPFYERVRKALSFRGHLRGDTFTGCLPEGGAPPARIQSRYSEPCFAGRSSELPAPL